MRWKRQLLDTATTFCPDMEKRNVLCLHLCERENQWRPPLECREAYNWIDASSIPEMLVTLRTGMIEVVIVDSPTPGVRVDDILLEVLRFDQQMKVIVASVRATTEDVIRLTRLGAYHVWAGDSSVARIAPILESAALARSESRQRSVSPDRNEPWRKALVGESDSMLRMIDVIRLIAARRSSVLITGETGTGKEVVARAIHNAGGRSHLPFIAVNCGAIPANLMESELFGYAKGAFTGATTTHAGRFEQANGGTIFLDEIGDLSLELQGKLLRVLQERELQRLGSSETIRLNVRVLAATNVNLERAVEQRTFREDLYYRLNVVPLKIPALRERASDIPHLVEHFVRRICAAEDLPEKQIMTSAMERLVQHNWPGNVRQLEHAVEQAVVLSGDRKLLDLADFGLLHASGSGTTPREERQLSREGLDFEETISNIEWSLIQQALVFANGNKARAAELLRMKRTTLLAKLRSLEVRRGACDLPVCA